MTYVLVEYGVLQQVGRQVRRELGGGAAQCLLGDGAADLMALDLRLDEPLHLHVGF